MNKNQILIISLDHINFSKEKIMQKLQENHYEFKKNIYFFANSSLLKKFNDEEFSINIQPDIDFFAETNNPSIFSFKKVSRAVIFASLNSICPNSLLMKIFIISDALKRSLVDNIELVIPYLPYLRQDRRMVFFNKINSFGNKNNPHNNDIFPKYIQNSEPITSKLIITLLQNSGISKLYIIDAHFDQINSFNDQIEIDNLKYDFLLGDILSSIIKIFFNTNEIINKNYNFDNICILFKNFSKLIIKQKYQNFDFNKIYNELYNKNPYDLFDDFLNNKNYNIENFKNKFSDTQSSEIINKKQYFELFFCEFINFFLKDFALVSPDAGALKKIRNCEALIEEIILLIIKIFNLKINYEKKNNICFIEKNRVQAGISFCMSITGDTNNKHCLIIDDILDSGTTLVSASKIIKDLGSCSSVSAFITHPIISSECDEKIKNSNLKFVFVSNSISSERHRSKLNSKFKIFDLFDILFEHVLFNNNNNNNYNDIL
jgi:phosphoribosylpyrophosphate synthetase